MDQAYARLAAAIAVTLNDISDIVWYNLLKEFFKKVRAKNDAKAAVDRVFVSIVHICRKVAAPSDALGYVERVAILLEKATEFVEQEQKASTVDWPNLGEHLRRFGALAFGDDQRNELNDATNMFDELRNNMRYDGVSTWLARCQPTPCQPQPRQLIETVASPKPSLSPNQKECASKLVAKIYELLGGERQFGDGVSVCCIVPSRNSLVQQTRKRICDEFQGALVLPANSAAAPQFHVFADAALTNPDRLFVVVVDECHYGIRHDGELSKKFLHCDALIGAARDNRNVVSIHVSATLQNNLVVPRIADRVIEIPPPPSYIGFEKLCNEPARLLVDATARDDAALCVDYASAFVECAAAIVCAQPPVLAPSADWMAAAGKSATHDVVTELLRRWCVGQPGLVVLRLQSKSAAKLFVQKLKSVVDALGLAGIEVLYELGGGDRNFKPQENEEEEYEKLFAGRLAIVVLVSCCQMGDTFPPSLFAYDLRVRFSSSLSYQSTFLQDVGRAFGYGRENVRVVLSALVGAQLRGAANQTDKLKLVFHGKDTIDGYVKDRCNPDSRDSAQFVGTDDNMFSRNKDKDAALLACRVYLCAEPQQGKTATYIEALRQIIAKHGGRAVGVAKPPDGTAAPAAIEWMLPSAAFVAEAASPSAIKRLSVGKYHQRLQRMRVHFLLESLTLDEYRLKVARVECIDPTTIVTTDGRADLPRIVCYDRIDGAIPFLLGTDADVARFRELVDFDSKTRGFLLAYDRSRGRDRLRWALKVRLAEGGLWRALGFDEAIKANCMYMLDHAYHSTTNLFVYDYKPRTPR